MSTLTHLAILFCPLRRFLTVVALTMMWRSADVACFVLNLIRSDNHFSLVNLPNFVLLSGNKAACTLKKKLGCSSLTCRPHPCGSPLRGIHNGQFMAYFTGYFAVLFSR
ncbi:hypothetical protein GYMLUDRAFT_824193 [Collybiopsis luxurians FD-317 M1]|uniref:Secreted protein n=1 Tax=Collybiopsis luxurians FD-317 M1 TaxID=944289 RepID=A0A0D0CDF0_9AGAR|nr:hypothetical protein GYMLUDRAFT_824193 [Collybiopsis luxurians FD-317 M1]